MLEAMRNDGVPIQSPPLLHQDEHSIAGRGVTRGESAASAMRRAHGHALPIASRDDATVCVTMPQRSLDPALRDDAPQRYVVVSVMNRMAPGPLVAYLYDLGAVHGYRLVGTERPEAGH